MTPIASRRKYCRLTDSDLEAMLARRRRRCPASCGGSAQTPDLIPLASPRPRPSARLNDVQRDMLEAAARRPRGRGEQAYRLRDG